MRRAGNQRFSLRAAFRGTCTWPLVLLGLAPSSAFGLTIEVVDPTGAPVPEFKFLVEEDTNFTHVPGDNSTDILAYNFHRSYMPPVVEGTGADGLATVDPQSLDPAKQYFVSVLPAGGYTMGGVPATAEGTAQVVVHPLPLPTAQIVVDVYNDFSPVNNQRDQGPEEGLGGFELLIEDAAGRYGASGALLTTDAFGNPLGTTYEMANGVPVLVDGAPKVLALGDGTVETDANGRAVVANLPPGKYGVRAVPPRGTDWIQTTTLEGTPIIDAWVKANEPPYFAEFGPPGPHVEIGFTRPFTSPLLTGPATIEGKVVNLHNSRPPEYTFYAGGPTTWTTCNVALNAGPGGVNGTVYTGQCDVDGSFRIPNVPAGNYQLAIWDENLDYVFAFYDVSVNADGTCSTPNGSCNLQNVPVFSWFHRLVSRVFADGNRDGFPDPGEPGIANIPINVLWRDGTMYQSQPTDGEGMAEFNEVFPFFHWLVAEVDGARLAPTGVTTVTDGGGAVPPDNGWAMPSMGQLTPMVEAGGQHYNTETGSILTRAFQGFLGQTNRIEWGKGAPLNPTVSGTVRYAVTRAEDEPRYAAIEPWEPGIPRVPVFLYPKSAETDGLLDLADVDHYPFNWSSGRVRGPEDIARAVRPDGVDPATDPEFRMGDAIAATVTDSWDDSLPTECLNPDPFTPAEGGPALDCYDGLRNYNQVRPGVFDGGYAFEEVAGAPLSSGSYIVESVLPAPYSLVKEEDRNVDDGETYVPAPDLLPAECVGDDHLVPDTLTNGTGPAPFAGTMRPKCDRKLVTVTGNQNGVADFFGFTEVPIAAHFAGMVLNDFANEFDPASPQFGEKQAPKWVPVAIRDWTGREMFRIYTDAHGRYNGLLPSTYTQNLPTASGISPQMAQLCMNDPGPMSNGQIDPRFDRRLSQFCYTFQFMPGTTTYLDTPVLPVAAHASAEASPLDCEYAPGVPRVASVVGPGGLVPLITDGTAVGNTVTITALGPQDVPDPNGGGLVSRDYSFGAEIGAVTVTFRDPVTGAEYVSPAVTATAIEGGLIMGVEAAVPVFAANLLPRRLQVVVERDGLESTEAASLWVTTGGKLAYQVVSPGAPTETPIQDAIDAAPAGSVVFLQEGTYTEMPILHKGVHLQGTGPGAVTVVPAKYPTEKLQEWRQHLRTLVAGGTVDLLPNQTLGADEGANAILGDIEGAAIFVMDADPGKKGDKTVPAHGTGASVDGLTIIGGDNTGVIVNGYVQGFTLSNVAIMSNQGFYGGGVRVGHPYLTVDPDGEPPYYVDALNDNLTIAYSRISQNGSRGAAGGGIGLYKGARNYHVEHNFICGNFSQGDGGGIGHLGLSDGGIIRDNQILFNQSFAQAQTVSGGGVVIAGSDSITPDGLSEGSGNVIVDANVVHGNHAGAGDGGGVSLLRTSGPDADKEKDKKSNTIYVTNNMVTNNVSGLAGGAIALKDAAGVRIVHNTIVNNESTATAGEAFTAGQPNVSNPQPGGIASRRHSVALATLLKADKKEAAFSNPDLRNNIVRDNYSFYYSMDEETNTAGLLRSTLEPWQENLAVLPLADPTLLLEPYANQLGEAAAAGSPYAMGNAIGSVAFTNLQLNGDRSNGTTEVEVKTAISAQPALDEGGNFIDVRFAPLSVNAADGTVDYHVTENPLEPAGDPTVLDGKKDAILPSLVLYDIDGDGRSLIAPVVGADTAAPTTTALQLAQ